MNAFKKLIPYLKPYSWTFVGIIIAALIMSACEASIAAIVKLLFEEVFEKKMEDKKLLICLSIVGVYFVHGIARFIHSFYLRYTAEKVTNQVRLDLQAKLTRFNLSYHAKHTSGALMSKIMNDVSQIHYGVTKLTDIVKEPFTILLSFMWLLYLDWKLTFGIMLVAPLIFTLLKQLGRSARKYSLKQQESLEDVTSTYKETLDGMRIIHSYNLEKTAVKRIMENLKKYLGLRKLVLIREEIAGPSTEFLASITVACVFYYAATVVISGQSTVGAFMSYLTALAIMQAPLKKLQDAFIRLQGMVVSTERVFELLDAKEEVTEVENPKPFPQDWKTIEFKNVSFHYENGNIGTLKNINLQVKRGEMIAIVGESGSGKSTLLNLLERFYEPVSGTIEIGGINIRDMRLADLRQNIALVTQDVFLFNDTIEQNIKYGNTLKEKLSVEDCAELANAKDFVMKMKDGFQTKAGDRGTRLSGGEKQRISIARAFYKDAPIIILDEATSALDSQSEIEVQKGLEQLTKGRTVFIIAHRLSTIVNADRIIVLKDGSIVEEGTHSTLIQKQGLYSKFYNLQS
jgi:ATP-binding cassette subfamily B protein/subfamily B ATP-binding cassette protein MsbA